MHVKADTHSSMPVHCQGTTWRTCVTKYSILSLRQRCLATCSTGAARVGELLVLEMINQFHVCP